MPFLLQLPGLGMVGAMTILAAVGDISRFPTSKQLVGYAGLGARMHASGQVQRSGGNPRRDAMNCAPSWWKLPGWPSNTIPIGKGNTSERATRIGKHKAIVAIARKLLVAVWHVLTRERADIHADVQAIARKLLRWTGRCGTTRGLRRSQVALLRRSLDQLGLREGVAEVHFSGRVYRLSDMHREGETRLRAFLLPFSSGLCEFTTPLLEVSTKPWRAAPLREAGLDTAEPGAV